MDRELTHHRGEITKNVINAFDHAHNNKVVAEQMSQSVWDGGTEPVGADPIDLQLSRGATGSGQTSTSDTFDRHEKCVASDYMSWR